MTGTVALHGSEKIGQRAVDQKSWSVPSVFDSTSTRTAFADSGALSFQLKIGSGPSTRAESRPSSWVVERECLRRSGPSASAGQSRSPGAEGTRGKVQTATSRVGLRGESLTHAAL